MLRKGQLSKQIRKSRTSNRTWQPRRWVLKYLWTNFDTKLTLFPCGNSGLQSALDALKKEVAEDRMRLSLGIGDFKQWMRQNSVNADSLISDPDPSISSSDIHHVFAHNALVNLRSKDGSSAYANARKVDFHFFLRVLTSTHLHVKSIDARPSAVGYIAKVLAKIKMGEPEKVVQVFDLAFANCNPDESNLLLLIKVCGPYPHRSL